MPAARRCHCGRINASRRSARNQVFGGDVLFIIFILFNNLPDLLFSTGVRLGKRPELFFDAGVCQAALQAEQCAGFMLCLRNSAGNFISATAPAAAASGAP